METRSNGTRDMSQDSISSINSGSTHATTSNGSEDIGATGSSATDKKATSIDLDCISDSELDNGLEFKASGVSNDATSDSENSTQNVKFEQDTPTVISKTEANGSGDHDTNTVTGNDVTKTDGSNPIKVESKVSLVKDSVSVAVETMRAPKTAEVVNAATQTDYKAFKDKGVNTSPLSPLRASMKSCSKRRSFLRLS